MCHDPKNINLSQETNINECVLIGTRRGAGEGKPTTFLNLSRYPLNTDDARAIAAALREGNFDAIGQVTDMASRPGRGRRLVAGPVVLRRNWPRQSTQSA